MRLVDADKLHESIVHGDGTSLQKFFADCCVAAAPTINPYEWISVEDRLPENFEDVLCWYEYFRYGEYESMYWTYGIGHYNDICEYWGGEVSNGYKSRVLAWMPLPSPPTEKEN